MNSSNTTSHHHSVASIVTSTLLLLNLSITLTISLELGSMRRHYSHFQAKQNHPTTYEENPDFKGPLILNEGITTSDNRCRIQNYYMEYNDAQKDNANHHQKQTLNHELVLPREQIKPLKPTTCTDTMLKSIVDHLAYSDAPVDVKEVAESIEFFLRTRKRLMGAAKKFHSKCDRERYKTCTTINNIDDTIQNANVDDSTTTTHVPKPKTIHVYDLCSGHGLTGMLFAACNPPTKGRVVNTILVDRTEPPSFKILSGLIGQICPWLKDVIHFEAMSLEEFQSMKQKSDINKNNFDNYDDNDDDDDEDDIAQLVIATHACGSLTDKVLEIAVDLGACGIAAMPCCYTGTDKGTPYGIKRALGVSWAADIRRCFYLNDNNYHSDLATIPKEITPMNRIIFAEDKS